LGLSQSATQDDIKNAYRKLAKKYHPDLNPGNKEAEAKFKEANQAYEMLGTPEQRAKYDRGEMNEGPFGPQGAGAGQGFEGFGRRGPFYYETQSGPSDGRYSQFFAGDFGAGSEEDLFSSLFGGRRARKPTKGEDTHYAMEIDFREAVLGGEREIQLPSGKRLRVKIPAGIETGKRLRFAGQGEAGPSWYANRRSFAGSGKTSRSNSKCHSPWLRLEASGGCPLSMEL
jgi:DnaJ-class molecular chaperone